MAFGEKSAPTVGGGVRIEATEGKPHDHTPREAARAARGVRPRPQVRGLPARGVRGAAMRPRLLPPRQVHEPAYERGGERLVIPCEHSRERLLPKLLPNSVARQGTRRDEERFGTKKANSQSRRFRHSKKLSHCFASSFGIVTRESR